ncbi:NAD(P)H-binding protein [Streptomyces acidicola]|uniref:NAD(P)H-binding protein n=1 Tax=Streptomyces acidicola TaxID=2596892 RepID=UPI00342F1414
MSVAPTIRSATLVVGGRGKTGRRVVERLATLGHPVRVGSRSGEPPFVWEDAGTWQAALDGVDRVYVAHHDMTLPDAAQQIEAFSQAAVASGVRRLVLLSGRGGGTTRAVESAVQVPGADWTVVRPGWFNQNFSEGFLLEAVLAREIALPEFGAKQDFVDVDDIADVAVAALTDDRHIGRTYELSGPRLLSFADAAEELSTAGGREITYAPLTVEQFRTSLLKGGMPEKVVDDFVRSLRDNSACVTHGVEEALGRKPKDFAAYARETAATGVWNA